MHRRKNTGEPSIGSPVFSIQLIYSATYFNVSGLGLYLRQCLINVGDYILGILDSDRKPDEVGRNSCREQLLVGAHGRVMN